MSKDNRTWRERRAQLQPNKSEVYFFSDTQPNHILISNPAPAALYVGVSGEVNPQTYDLAIPPYGTRLYARMNGTQSVYFYSDSVEPVNIQLTSWVAEFNPASVAQSVEMIGAGADGLLGIVEINNILSSLPTGENVIGGVFISDFAKPLPNGNNKIGSVDVAGGTLSITDGSINVTQLPQDGAAYMKVTAAAAGIVNVKAGTGYVYQLAGNPLAQLMDGTNPAWLLGEFKSDTPLICAESIQVQFTEPGDAYILFK